MSRCTRCGHRQSAHLPPYPIGTQRETVYAWQRYNSHRPCPRHQRPDPWWIRALARIGKGRL